jgi:hypothetical protein
MYTSIRVHACGSLRVALSLPFRITTAVKSLHYLQSIPQHCIFPNGCCLHHLTPGCFSSTGHQRTRHHKTQGEITGTQYLVDYLIELVPVCRLEYYYWCENELETATLKNQGLSRLYLPIQSTDIRYIRAFLRQKWRKLRFLTPFLRLLKYLI